MAPTPSLQEVIQLVEADTHDEQPLSRLETASAVVQNLAEVGDAALGYFVDQARHAGHSWSEIGQALGVSKQAAQQKHTVRLSLDLNAPTFERFTPRARHVVGAAESIAREFGQRHVGTEHLLLALYREPEGVAAQVLDEADLSAARAKAAVDARAEPGPGAPDDKVPFAPQARAALSGALSSALEMGHNYIGTEHLLLGLVRGAGLAADILGDAGLDQEALERRVTEKLARYAEALRVLQQDVESQVTRGARPKKAPAARKPSRST